MSSSETPLTIIVTGGNQGIGLATVDALSSAGHTVVLTSRNIKAGQEAAAGLAHSERVHVVSLDITDESSLAALPHSLANVGIANFHVLINNAGMAFKGDTFGPEEAQATLDVNLYGTKNVTDTLLPLMVTHDSLPGYPRIINVCSRAGRISQTTEPLTSQVSATDLDWDTLDQLASAFPPAIADGSHLTKGYSSSMYGMSKVFEIAYTLAVLPSQIAADEHKLEGNKPICYALCPGYVSTSMSSFKGTKTPEEGADTSVFLATTTPAPTPSLFYAEREPIDWDTSL